MGLNERIVVYGLIVFLGLVVFGVVDKDRLFGKTEPAPEAVEPTEPEPAKLEDGEFAALTVHSLRLVTPDGKVVVTAGLDKQSGAGFVAVGNADGNPAATLSTDSEGAGALRVYRKDGQRAAQLAVRWGSGNLMLENAKALPIVTLGNTPKKGSVLQLSKDDGTVVTSVQGGNEGGSITVRDSAGKTAVSVTSLKGVGAVGLSSAEAKMTLSGDKTGLTLSDGKGNALFKARSDKNGGGIETFNRNGRVANSIGVSDDGTGAIHVRDAAGESKFAAYVTTVGGLMRVYNRAGKSSVVVGTDTKEYGLVSVHAPSGKKHAEFYAGDEHGGMLTVFDAKGETSSKLRVGADGGFLRIYNGGGKMVSYLGAGKGTGRGLFQVNDNLGRSSLEMFGAKKGGWLQAFDTDDKAIAAIGMGKNGRGLVQVLNPNGNIVAELIQGVAGGALYVRNNSGKDTGMIVTDSNDAAGYMQICNSAGAVYAAVGAQSRGGYMHINHSNGKSAATMKIQDDSGIFGTWRRSGKQSGVIGLR